MQNKSQILYTASGQIKILDKHYNRTLLRSCCI
nr:MAG TPA: hypothetical protein [Bacteriophage sp.]